MTGDSDLIPARYVRVPRVAGAAASAIGALVLAGWLFGIEGLKSGLPGLVAMKANTAVAFILAGVSLWLSSGTPSGWSARVGGACALAVVAVGLLNIAEYATGRDLGIDQLLVRDLATARAPYPGRLAMNTAVNFVLLGVPLLRPRAGAARTRWLAEVCTVAVAFIALVAPLGYAFSASADLGTGPSTQMALHTVLAFLVLCVGILARDRDGPISRIAASDGPGSLIVRRLLPGVVATVLVLSWFALNGHRAGLYDTFFGFAFTMLAALVALSIASFWGAATLNRADAERRRAETHLRWLTLAVEQSPAAVLITDAHGTIEYVNPTFTQISGYSAAEAIGHTPSIIKSGLTPPEVYEGLWKTITAGEAWRGELQNRRKTGEMYWDAIWVSPMRDVRGTITHFLSVQEDITQRLEVDSALRESERRARALFDTVRLVVLGLDAAGRVDYVNPFFLKLTGYTREEVIGQPWVERFLPASQHAAMLASFRETLERGLHPHHENPILTKSGEERVIAWNNTVLQDAEGRPTGTLSIGEDITGAKRLEAQLLHSQKLESVGRLAGGVAHDFNNLLTVILSNTEFVLEDLPPDSPLRSDVDEIRKAADRATMLTRQLLAFARRQVTQPRIIDLNDVAINMDKLLRRLIGTDIELVTLLQSGVWPVRADPGQIEQVIVNLAVNSRDAMAKGGRLTIETANVTLDPEYAETRPGVVPGDHVMLAVSDTGEGMPEEVRLRVFDPFFTTKSEGKGTGLGLATVYGIVNQAGGHVWVYSERGHGTTFKVYLPRAAGKAEPVAPVLEGPALRGTETVLIVEDEAQVLSVASRTLTALGYRVIEAPNGIEALRIADSRGSEIDLLLTDLVMPQMGGKDLAIRLVGRHPGLKVLYTSGYTGQAVILHDHLDKNATFLAKPYVPATLARMVREVLDAPRVG